MKISADLAVNWKKSKVRSDRHSDNLNDVIQLDEHDTLTDNNQHTGPMSQMIIEYVLDVSSLLSMVSSVQEMTFTSWTCISPSAKYLAYQHVTFSIWCISISKAWEDLAMNGFGGNISGEPFSSKHGDLLLTLKGRSPGYSGLAVWSGGTRSGISRTLITSYIL